ncbi:hypothetical protein BGZ94_008650 [Podila epigama]|nr:hypothetical protein BGZ94_008650 [Podila epigama]
MASLHYDGPMTTPATLLSDTGSSNVAPPPVNQHFILSPVPASQVSATSQSPRSGTASGADNATATTVTLYPLEPVPPHLLCAICTLPYENPVHFLPCCHVFCLECIQLWIGMNLNDDLLQNELRRAFPAEGDYPSLSSDREPLAYELSVMGNPADSRSRSGVSNGGAFYDNSLNDSYLAQQQQLHQQQRVAIILENREMPKCPMCRTALHIHGWDRIEEQIKVPIRVNSRPNRPYPNSVERSASAEWLDRSTTNGQRPVSGVQRRRLRSDRPLPGRSLGREDSIGEEQEEEIEMEQVGTLHSDPVQSPAPPSTSVESRRPHSRRDPRSHLGGSLQTSFPRTVYPQTSRLFDHTEENQDFDLEDQQSPTTAIIGRRPSEWMRYQQRQLQAHQAQQQQQRQQQQQQQSRWQLSDHPLQLNNDVPFDDYTLDPRQVIDDRYENQQERIQLLYREQESQEELLRSLTARAASILGSGNDSREQTPSNSTSPSSSTSTHMIPTTRAEEAAESVERGDSPSEDQENNIQQSSQQRRSVLHVDTSVARPNVRSSQEVDLRQLDRETDQLSAHSPATAVNRASVVRNRGQERGLDQAFSQEEETSGRRSSIVEALQQETRAWAHRSSNLALGDQGHVQEQGQGQRQDHGQVDDEEQGEDQYADHSAEASHSRASLGSRTDIGSAQGFSRSSSSSGISSSGTQSLTLAMSSPTNTLSFSYRTSSTFSHSRLTRMSSDSPFSLQSPDSSNHWDQPLALQMPVMESDVRDLEEQDNEELGDSVSASRQESSSLGTAHDIALGDNLEEVWRANNNEPEQTSVSTCNGVTNGQPGIDQASGVSNLPGSDSDMHDDGDGDAHTSSVCCSTTGSSRSETEPESLRANGAPRFLQASEIQHWKTTAGSSSMSGVSPMIQELDIHSPIVTSTQGSVTTLADMQIDADILARARAGSALVSDDDDEDDTALGTSSFRSSRYHHHRSSSVSSSPVDSPVPTPSTARPRQRFPTGIRLTGEGHEDDVDDDDEQDDAPIEHTQEEDLAQDEQPVTATASHRASLSRRPPSNVSAGALQGTPTLTDATQEHQEAEGEQDVVVVTETAAETTGGIQDPLTGAINDVDPRSSSRRSSGRGGTDDQAPSSSSSSSDRHPSVEMTTRIEVDSLRLGMSSSPPPLPLPVVSSTEEVEQEETRDTSSSLASELARAAQASETQSSNRRRSRSSSASSSTIQRQSQRQSQQDGVGHSLANVTEEVLQAHTSAAAEAPPPAQTAPDNDQEEQGEEEEEEQVNDALRPRPSSLVARPSSSVSTSASNTPPGSSLSESRGPVVEEHVQYRTLVRYQPRLPKAHVMSDLISQTKVECSQKQYGCLEIMEMQQAQQHGREQCKFRLVTCPRPRCGLRMRADQILEHILMVEQPQPSPPSSSSSGSSKQQSSPPGSLRSAQAIIPSLKSQGRGSRRNQFNSTTKRTEDSTVGGGRKNGDNKNDSTSATTLSSASSASDIPPCPGLTWEREQLARATGIIGQLTEENTSLRQMIRQLTLQNSKLVKEKDRFQRYANLGLGRD